MQGIGPKLEASGVFAGKRQGVMVLNVASEDDAFSLRARRAAFRDIDAYPVTSPETLGKYLAESQIQPNGG